MNYRHRQRGLSLISWMIVISIAVFFGVVGIKSIPVYMNHFKIVSIMKNVAQSPGAREQSAAEFRKSFERRFDIDMVQHLNAREIRVVGTPGGDRAILAEYEVRIPMFYNVDAVYSFNEEIPIGSR